MAFEVSSSGRWAITRQEGWMPGRNSAYLKSAKEDSRNGKGNELGCLWEAGCGWKESFTLKPVLKRWLTRIIYVVWACLPIFLRCMPHIPLSSFYSQIYRGRDTSLELTETRRLPAQSSVSSPSEWIQSKCGKNGSRRCFLSWKSTRHFSN